MDPTRRWRELVAGPEAGAPLDEAALLIAAHARPGLAVADELARLDRLAEEVRADDTAALVDLLFGRLGLTGAVEDYDNPDNSCLDRVLDRGVGIPISLSVLMIEVGRRRGVELDGIGMPGHFLVRDRARPDELIDPHGGGRRLDGAACLALFRSLLGTGAHLHPAMLAPVGPHAILARMLANLDRSYRRRADGPALTWVARLRASIPGQPAAVLLEVAGTLAEMGRFDEAADVADGLAATALRGDGADRLRARSREWRSRLN